MIFNWTDTRGDIFAVADTETEQQARDLIRLHAYADYIERGMTIEEAHRQAAAFARKCKLRTVKRGEFGAFITQQIERNG